MLIPKGAGRVSPDKPLSPPVTAAQRYAVPHRTCDRASVIIRKPRPVARNAIQPNRPAINVVTTSASGAVIQWARPRRKYSHAEVYVEVAADQRKAGERQTQGDPCEPVHAPIAFMRSSSRTGLAGGRR